MVFFLSFVELPYQWSCTSCCVGHFEPLLEGSFRRVLLMGHSRDVYLVNRCESANLSTSSVLFLLSFNKFVSSNNCKSTRYLWRRPVRRESHTRAIRAQCACVLPIVPLMRASFPSVIYLNVVCLFVVVVFCFVFCCCCCCFINLFAQCRLPGNYRANTSFWH